MPTASQKTNKLKEDGDPCFFSPSSPFLPTFLQSDKILDTLSRYGFCDKKGNPLTPFDSDDFFSLKFNCPEDKAIIQAIFNYLETPREMATKLPAALEEIVLKSPFVVSIHLISLFEHLIEQASQAREFLDSKGNKQVIPPAPIQEIEFIGRGLIKLLTKHPFYQASLQRFKAIEEQEPGLIQEWFQDETVNQFFQQIGTDDDFRLTLDADSSYSEHLILETINELGKTLKNFSDLAPFYVKELSKIKGYYTDLERDSDIIRISMKEFGGIGKWTSILNDKDEYSILGLKTRTKDIDLLFVRRLKKNHLFSTDSLKALLKNFLASSRKKAKLSLSCKPFTVTKYLIDALAKICSVFDRNMIDQSHWLKFLTFATCQGNRLMEKDLEAVCVRKMLESDSYSTQGFSSQPSDRKTSPDLHQDYLCKLIKKHIRKHHHDQLEIIAYLFNASQSLLLHASSSDETIRLIWLELEKEELFKLEKNNPLHAFSKQIADALLIKKIPFSELTAWLQLYAFIFFPKTLTTHNGYPAFSFTLPHSKPSLTLLLPCLPLKSLETVFKALVKGANSSFAHEFLRLLLDGGPSRSVYPSPLIEHVDNLPFQPEQLIERAQMLIEYDDTFMSYLGFQLYLASPAGKVQSAFISSLCYRLPKILALFPSRKALLLDDLKRLLNDQGHDFFSPYLSFLNRPMKESEASDQEDWINKLALSHNPQLIREAFHLFKEINRRISNKAMGLNLFNALRNINLSHAYFVLNALRRQTALTIDERCRSLTLLCKNPSLNTLSLDNLINLSHFFEHLLELNNEEAFDYQNWLAKPQHKNDFIGALVALIRILHQQSYGANTGDNLLLQASYKKDYQSLELGNVWLERLERLTAGPNGNQNPHLPAMLCQLAQQNGFLDVLPKPNCRLQEIKLTLIQALKVEHLPLKRTFLEELVNETTVLSSNEAFGQSIILFVEESLQQNDVSLSTITLLHKFFQLNTPSLRCKACDLVKQTAKQLASQLENSSAVSSELIEQMDQLLLKPEAWDEFKTVKSWSSFIFPYLNRSLELNSPSRFPAVWTFFIPFISFDEKATLSQKGILLLIAALRQASASCKTLPIFLFDWLNTHVDPMLNKLKASGLIKEIAAFIPLLEHFSCVVDNLELRLQVSEKLVDESLEPANLQLVKALLDNIMNAKQAISPIYSRFLRLFVDCLIKDVSHEKLLQASAWIDACRRTKPSTHEEREEHHALMIEISSFFIRFHEPLKAINILEDRVSLSASQKSQVHAQWLSLIPTLQTNAYYLNLGVVLLSTSVQENFEHDRSTLRRFCLEVIQTLTEQSFIPHQLVFDLLNVNRIQEESAWSEYWRTLASTDQTLLKKKSWEFFKTLDHGQSKAQPLAKAACWVHALSNLATIKHPDLWLYLLEEQTLDPFFETKDANIRELAIKAWRYILLGCIAQLPPSFSDFALFQRIDSQFKKILSLCKLNQKHISDQETLIFNEISLALLKQTNNSLCPGILIRLAELLNSLIMNKNDKTDCKQLAKFLDALVRESISLHPQGIALLDSDPLKYLEDNLFNTNDSICALVTMASEQLLPFSEDYFISIASSLINNPSEHSLLQALSIHLKLFECERAQKDPLLKKDVGRLLDALLVSGDSRLISSIENYLAKSLSSLSFTKEKSAELSHIFLNYAFHYQLSFYQALTARPDQKEAIDLKIGELINIYMRWAPKLFLKPNQLKNYLETILVFISHYAREERSPDNLDEEKFQTYLFDILSIKTVAAETLENSQKECRESIDSYIEWLLNGLLYLRNIRQDFVIRAISKHITDLMDQKTSKKDVVKLIGLLIYCLPPPFDLKVIHFEICQQTFRQANKLKYFSEEPNLAFEYRFYLGLVPEDYNLNGKKEEMLSAWTKTMSFTTFSSYQKAVYILVKLFPILLAAKETKRLLGCYQAMANKSIEFPACAVLVGRKTALRILFDSTINHRSDMSNWNAFTKEQMAKIYFIQLQALTSCWIAHIKGTDKYDLKFCYLDLALSLIDQAVKVNTFKNHKDYFGLIETWMPFIRKIIGQLQRPSGTGAFNCSSLELSSRLIQLILTKMPAIALSAHEQKLQKELFFKWLNLLTTPLEDDENFSPQSKEYAALHLCQGFDENITASHEPACLDFIKNLNHRLGKETGAYCEIRLQIAECRSYGAKSVDRLIYLNRIRKIILSISNQPAIFIGNEFDIACHLIELIIKDSQEQQVEQQICLQELYRLLVYTFQQNIENILYKVKNEEIPRLLYLAQTSSLEELKQKANSYLICLINKGIEAKLFNESHFNAQETFEQFATWLMTSDIPSIETILQLLRARFDPTYLNKDTLDSYFEMLQGIMPSLKDLIFDFQDCNFSFILLSAISLIPTDKNSIYENKQAELFMMWLNTFNNSNNLLKRTPAFKEHIKNLLNLAIDKGVIHCKSSIATALYQQCSLIASKLTEGLSISSDFKDVMDNILQLTQ